MGDVRDLPCNWVFGAHSNRELNESMARKVFRFIPSSSTSSGVDYSSSFWINGKPREHLPTTERYRRYCGASIIIYGSERLFVCSYRQYDWINNATIGAPLYLTSTDSKPEPVEFK